MMESTNYNVLEVALENGFGTLNAFERSFRRLIGVAPNRFEMTGDS